MKATKERRKRILDRQGNRCAWCYVPDKGRGTRDSVTGHWISEESWKTSGAPLPKLITIVLTVLFTGRPEESRSEDENYEALCQRCASAHRSFADQDADATGAGQLRLFNWV